MGIANVTLVNGSYLDPISCSQAIDLARSQGRQVVLFTGGHLAWTNQYLQPCQLPRNALLLWEESQQSPYHTQQLENFKRLAHHLNQNTSDQSLYGIQSPHIISEASLDAIYYQFHAESAFSWQRLGALLTFGGKIIALDNQVRSNAYYAPALTDFGILELIDIRRLTSTKSTSESSDTFYEYRLRRTRPSPMIEHIPDVDVIRATSIYPRDLHSIPTTLSLPKSHEIALDLSGWLIRVASGLRFIDESEGGFEIHFFSPNACQWPTNTPVHQLGLQLFDDSIVIVLNQGRECSQNIRHAFRKLAGIDLSIFAVFLAGYVGKKLGARYLLGTENMIPESRKPFSQYGRVFRTVGMEWLGNRTYALDLTKPEIFSRHTLSRVSPNTLMQL